jgi:hypothetical protein
MLPRRFPPPWPVDEADSILDRRCFIVRDANGQALAYVYFEEQPGPTRPGQAAHPRRGAADGGEAAPSFRIGCGGKDDRRSTLTAGATQ